MATSIPYASTRPIILQQHHNKASPSSSSSYSSEHDIADSSPDSSYERLPPLTPSPKPQPAVVTQPVARATSSTIASTTSVNTYDSRLSSEHAQQLPNSGPQLHEEKDQEEDEDVDDTASEDSEHDQPVQLLPDDAAIPSALPIYRLPPINDYPVRPTSPLFFSELFPTLDRLTVRHDDLTPDGNMNLRIETPPHFLLSNSTHDAPQCRSSSSRRQHQPQPPPPRRPVAFQLFHLRMHDLARREFSLRRYCRDSGREICSSKRGFVVEGQQRIIEDVDDDEDEQQPQMQDRPCTKRTVSSAFQSITQPFQRTNLNNSSPSRRPASSYNAHQKSDSRSTFSSSQDAKSISGSIFSTDKLSTAPSSSDSVTKTKPVKIATDTIKLEFSNYARVDLTRTSGEAPEDAVLYEFEWWGHEYAWRRVVDENTEMVSYHLLRDGKGKPVAHIVPETRGLAEAKADENVGGWVPPCHIWISDKSVIEAKTDVADVVMATGLLTLVDDSIRTRWQLPQQFRPAQPVKSYTGDGITPRPKGLLNSIFSRRRSEQYTSRNSMSMKRGRLAAVY